MKTETKILNLLKNNGAMTAKFLAKELRITTMGIRQHMLKLEQKGEITFEDRKASRGRPTRYWILAEKSNIHFPDGHETLNLQLIESVKSVFGEQGLDKLIKQREKESFVIYSKILNQQNNLIAKLEALAHIRSNEGYMAQVENKQGEYWLLENHCSICAAASTCLDFCRSELQLFQQLFKNIASITREEHIMQGARRCAYRVIPIE
jgi:predicted ArsR family transcriptional regulator